MIPAATTGLDKKNQEKIRSILNCLTESTFFYRTDAPELYVYLRRNAQAFKDFFQTQFGWRLYIDEQVARLIKERVYNESVRPSQRALFNLRRRDECLLFAILLEFHDYERNQQGLTAEEADSLKFYYGDYLSFAHRRATDELGENAPGFEQLQSAGKELFAQLDRHRFIRLVERKAAERDDADAHGLREHLLYEMLPGIRCYDPTLLHQRAVFERYIQKARGEPETDADETATEPDKAEEAVE